MKDSEGGCKMAYCTWSDTSEAEIAYHDNEWGVPLHDDRGQFEFITLEVMQCGLSWALVMKKREILRSCFDDFDHTKIMRYGGSDVERIMACPGMIRSKRKIEAVISNAKAFEQIRTQFGSFSEYIWSFTNGKTILYDGHEDGWIPASNGLSEKVSKDLKSRGFKYTGPVVMYSHMQACGMINDHDRSCPCFSRLTALYPVVHMACDAEKDVRYYGD